MRKFWLVSTDHLEDELWFRDEDDFKVGMNYVAIEAAMHPDVTIFTFILMSNHVHFVMNGEREEVKLFIDQFKHRYSIYVSKKWGAGEFLRRNGVDIKEIPSNDEAVERAIAYVDMNCVSANICMHPAQYPWGSGGIFFSSNNLVQARALGTLKTRARERILHSNCTQLPQDWRVCSQGYILQQEYVDVDAVERLFRTPQRMNYFLKTSSKARKRLEVKENLPAFSDQTIRSAMPELYRSLFQKYSLGELLPSEIAELMRQIRFRFSADVNQIARVCGVSYADAAKMMDSSD